MARLTRRRFIQGSAAIGSSLAVGNLAPGLFAAGNDTIRLGLVGCGGRGAGAVAQALGTGRDVQLTAMADVFHEKIDNARELIRRRISGRSQVQVDAEHEFSGVDAYEKLLASGVDVVILATPPAFRPLHFEAAVDAGVHVFLEKPLAVDAPGVIRLIAASKTAQAKSLKVAVGLQHRHDTAYREAVQRLKDGAIGEIQSMTADWRSGGLKAPRVTRADVKSELELQVHNWVYFVWISGEINLEQNIHNVDVCNWIKGTHPVSATGRCGRTVRVGSKYGDVHDEFVIDYRYDDGTKLRAHARHHPAPANAAEGWNYVGETAQGTNGTADLKMGTIEASRGSWKFSGPRGNAHQTEQDRLFAVIRDGRPYNEIDATADSQLTMVMGRMAAYTGETVTWEQAQSSNELFVGDQLSFTGVAPTMPDKFGDYLVPAQGRVADA